jgi:hypothetical protein
VRQPEKRKRRAEYAFACSSTARGSRDADRTEYGYGRSLDGEHTASGRTVTYPYLHV